MPKSMMMTSDSATLRYMLSFMNDRFVFLNKITIRIKTIKLAGRRMLYLVMNVPGKNLCVTVTKLPAEEEFPCTMLGISYPHIKIMHAEERK